MLIYYKSLHNNPIHSIQLINAPLLVFLWHTNNSHTHTHTYTTRIIFAPPQRRWEMEMMYGERESEREREIQREKNTRLLTANTFFKWNICGRFFEICMSGAYCDWEREWEGKRWLPHNSSKRSHTFCWRASTPASPLASNASTDVVHFAALHTPIQ